MEMDGERKRESLRDVLCIEEEEEERGEEMSLCFFFLPGAARRSFKPFCDTVMEIYIGLSAQSDLTCFVMINVSSNQKYPLLPFLRNIFSSFSFSFLRLM